MDFRIWDIMTPLQSRAQATEKLSVGGNIVVARNAIYVALFGLLAAYFLAWPVWRSQFLIEIWLTEGWNAYFQDAAAAGARLYPEANSLTVNNYPPLSFYFVGLLGQMLGDNLFVGRGLSLAGLIGVAVEIFLCARMLSGGRAGPMIGALWYVAIMAHNSSIYVGANDPQLAGEAIMGAGMVLMLARDRAGKSATPALLLMVVGGFWKHNMIGIPLTAVAWLFLNHGKQAVRPVAMSALAAGAGLIVCGGIFGKEFFENLLVARKYSLGQVVANIGHLQWSAPAFIIWAIWASTNRSVAARFTMLHVLISLFACLLQWFGDGVFGNAEFDLILALGIATGVTFEGMKSTAFARRSIAQAAMVAILAIRLVASERQEPMRILVDPHFRSEIYALERSVRADADRVANLSGSVYCTNKLVCRLAGKAFVADDFKVEQMTATRAIARAQLDQILRSQNITTFRSGG
ncbi:MAG: hypothetical protein NVS4B4_10440 [Bradyrhizobium sp.]